MEKLKTRGIEPILKPQEKHTIYQDVSNYAQKSKYNYRFSRYQEIRLNNYQEFLYNRVMYGLEGIPHNRKKKLDWSKKNHIEKVHKRTLGILNVWKQEIVNDFTNSFMLHFFPKSPITKELVEQYGSESDKEYVNSLSWESLGISKLHIVEKLKLEKILPLDFDTLEDS